MKNIVLLVIITLVISSCTNPNKQTESESYFDLYGTSQFILSNKTNDYVSVTVLNFSRIINEEQSFDTLINSLDSVNFKLNIQGFQYFSFTVNEVYFKVFTAPNAIVRAEIISDSIVNFTGNYDSINTYLAQSSGTYYRSNEVSMELVNLTGNMEIDYEGITKKNDEIIHKHQVQLAKNKALLPNWYFDIETKRLAILGAYFKLNSLSYRKHLYKTEDNIPVGYVDSVTNGVPFQDERLMGFNTLQNYLQDYTVSSFNPLNDTTANRFKENYMDSLYVHAARFIPQPFSDYSLTSMLNSRLKRGKDKFKPEWIELVTDTVFKEFLNARYRKDDVLPIGAKVPSFVALNIDSNQFHFSGVQDTVVLINFWAAYCMPCIDNFGRENDLVEQFKDQPVKIINFCMETEFWRFSMLVEQFELQTLNLFADEKLSEQLRKKFDIYGIPHSILIDKNGLVVHNKCTVKGDGIVDEIEGLLE